MGYWNCSDHRRKKKRRACSTQLILRLAEEAADLIQFRNQDSQPVEEQDVDMSDVEEVSSDQSSEDEEMEEAASSEGESDGTVAGASHPDLLDETSAQLIDLTIAATDYRGKMEVREDKIRFTEIGGPEVLANMTSLVEATGDVLDTGIPTSPTDQQYINPENDVSDIQYDMHRDLFRDYEAPDLPNGMIMDSTTFVVANANSLMLQEYFYDANWRTFGKARESLLSCVPSTYPGYTDLQRFPSVAWRSMCHDLSCACTYVMRHCQRAWKGASLMRDTGGWITLRHAAIELKRLVNEGHKFGRVQKGGDRRQPYPLGSILKQATELQIEW